MKTDCKPPYDKCVHGSFYREALTAGFDEQEAERLTEMVKGLHGIEIWREFGGDIEKIIYFVKQAIAVFPTKLQESSIMIIYYQLDKLIMGDSFKLYDIEKEFSGIKFGNPRVFEDGFLVKLQFAIEKSFLEFLEGETITFTFENWLENSATWLNFKRKPNRRYTLETKKFETNIYPAEEYERIITAQNEVAEKYVNYYFEALKKQISQRLKGAKEPVSLLKDELEEIESLISKEDLISQYELHHGDGQTVRFFYFMRLYEDKGPKSVFGNFIR